MTADTVILNACEIEIIKKLFTLNLVNKYIYNGTNIINPINITITLTTVHTAKNAIKYKIDSFIVSNALLLLSINAANIKIKSMTTAEK